MFRNRISIFVATLLIIGFFFLALPEKGFSGLLSGLGCCLDSGVCIGCGGLECALNNDECMAAGGNSGTDSFFCLANGNCSGPIKSDDLGCCVLSEGNCNEDQEFQECDGVGIEWVFKTECSEVARCPDPKVTSPIPTLSEWGLIALAGTLGIIGFMVIRRRKVTA